MAYFIISKTEDSNGKRGLIDTMDNRQEARNKAKELDGTVKTQAEYDELVAAGKINTGEIAQGESQAEGEGSSTEDVTLRVDTDTAAVVNANPEGAVAHLQNAVTSGEAAQVAADLMGDKPQDGQPPVNGGAGSIMELAQQVKTATKVRKTVGTKEKLIKRPPTDSGILEAASEELKKLVNTKDITKVQIVRGLAMWNGKKLQRRDVFKLIKDFPKPLEIADATISTQFQFARSGKERQNG